METIYLSTHRKEEILPTATIINHAPQETRADFCLDVTHRSLKTRWNLRDTFEQLLTQAAGRIVAAEVKAIRKQLKQFPLTGEVAFRKWLEDFFEQHRAFAEKVIGPVIVTYQESVAKVAIDEVGGELEDIRSDLEVFSAEYVAAFGARHSSGGLHQLNAIIRDAEDAEAEIAQRLSEWEEKSAGKIGRNEATQAGAAVSRLVYGAMGVSILVWQANRGACPLCVQMHGRTVEISGSFLSPGDTVVPDDEDTNTLEVKQIRNHPPLHGGCQCSVSPG